MNRPVRTRMRGGVGRAGEKPALTRLQICFVKSSEFEKCSTCIEIPVRAVAINMVKHEYFIAFTEYFRFHGKAGKRSLQQLRQELSGE